MVKGVRNPGINVDDPVTTSVKLNNLLLGIDRTMLHKYLMYFWKCKQDKLLVTNSQEHISVKYREKVKQNKLSQKIFSISCFNVFF
jgi:hypothetical protein